jgi:enoyl-CoA hydratase
VALDAERKSFLLLAASQDRNEGIAAFLEKRSPTYLGR